MRVDPTVCRQLFRCGLPQSSSFSTPITPCPAPPGCNTQVPCRSVARSVHHGVTDKQGFCFLFALQLMFLACSTLPLNVLCLLYCLFACWPPQISVIRESTHLFNKPGKERESFKSSFPSQPRTNYISDNLKVVLDRGWGPEECLPSSTHSLPSSPSLAWEDFLATKTSSLVLKYYVDVAEINTLYIRCLLRKRAKF